MNASQIKRLLRDYISSHTLGVFPVDKLPTIPRRNVKYPFCLIANTDKCGNPGQHWVAIYVQSPEHGEFFDSLGRPPGEYSSLFLNFMKRYCDRMKWNVRQVQGIGSSVCGQYCLFYLMNRSKGICMDCILSPFVAEYSLNDRVIEVHLTDIL